MSMQQAEPYPQPYAAPAATAFQTFLSKVFGWMTVGLGITGVVSFYLERRFEQSIQSGTFSEGWFWAVIIAQLVVVLGLSFGINRISAGLATFLFLFYSALTGVTFGVIFTAYDFADVFAAFLVTGGTFGAMALIGYTTKRDLSRFGSFLIMALFGLIIASVVGFFFDLPAINWLMLYGGLVIFLGLTIVDVNRLKRMQLQGASAEGVRKAAIFGALQLYLDFINIFIRILAIMGGRRD